MEESSGGALFGSPRKVQQYDPELKKKVIARVIAGEKVPAVCSDLGIKAESTVHGWIYQYRHSSGAQPGVANQSRRPHFRPKQTSRVAQLWRAARTRVSPTIRSIL